MRGLASERAVIGGVTVELGDWLVVDTERHGKSRRARFRGEDPSGRIVVQSKVVH